MDGFKAVLNRIDTIISGLKGWNIFAFTAISLKNYRNQINLNNFDVKF